MGKRGPAKTPTAILEQRGSWLVKDRTEPVADGVVECPDWLSDHAKDVWDYVVPMLEKMGILGAVDSLPLARYCQLFARYIEAEQFLQEHGTVWAQKNAKGKVTGMVKFAQVSDAKHLANLLRQLEAQFGMNPASRPEINMDRPYKKTTGEISTEDVLDQLLSE